MKNIFISYAREDVDKADKIWCFLKDNGLNPWMDKHNLLPGQNFNYEISKAIKKSDFFLFIISKYSVNKRGYVQKELKSALDVFDEIPVGKIFFLPVRLDRTEPIDEKISKLHWLDLFPSWKHNIHKILKSIGLDDKKVKKGTITKKKTKHKKQRKKSAEEKDILKWLKRHKNVQIGPCFGSSIVHENGAGIIALGFGGKLEFVRRSGNNFWDSTKHDCYMWELIWDEKIGVVATERTSVSCK